MNETMKNLEQEELDGQMYLFKDEATVEESVEKQTNVPSSDDTLKEAIQEQLKENSAPEFIDWCTNSCSCYS